MRQGRRFIARRAARLLGVLVLLGAALPGLAEPTLEGRALVQAKDVARRTVTLDGTLFSVALTTELRGADGQSIQLQDLRVSEGTLGVVAVDEVDAVYYRARAGSALPVLEELRVLTRLPQ